MATGVSAHGGGPALEIVPAQAVVGETVSVFGEDLQPLGSVTVELLTAAGERGVLDAEVDDAGHLTGSFVVPELSVRVYELRATDSTGVQVSTYLTLVAPAGASAESVLVSPMGGVLLAILGAAMAVALMLTLGLRRRPRRSVPVGSRTRAGPIRAEHGGSEHAFDDGGDSWPN